MNTLKRQAVALLDSVPDNVSDDKMIYLINVLKDLTISESKSSNNAENVSSEKLAAWERLQKYAGSVTRDIDLKKELAEARDEKYARFD